MSNTYRPLTIWNIGRIDSTGTSEGGRNAGRLMQWIEHGDDLSFKHSHRRPQWAKDQELNGIQKPKPVVPVFENVIGRQANKIILGQFE